MKVDVERFTKQLDALTEQAYSLGWKKKTFSKVITDRIEKAWFDKQMADSQASLIGGMEPPPSELPAD